MLLSEEEAKTKWCPFARCNINNVSANRFAGAPYDNSLCIASQCMAWRWGHKEVDHITRGEPTQWSTIDLEQTDKGFCGLAGKFDL